jgi:hypothetical protein
MNSEESEMFEFLRKFPQRFVSVEEIVRMAGASKDLCQDRNWVQAILRRMEIEGWIESNPQGGYRPKARPDDTTSFLKALETPGAPLGDTAIITLEDVAEDRAGAV